MTERRELADTHEIEDSEREQREGWEQRVKDWLVSTALLALLVDTVTTPFGSLKD